MSRRKIDMEFEQKRQFFEEFLSNRMLCLLKGVPINNVRVNNIIDFIDKVAEAVTKFDISAWLESAENRYPVMRAVFKTGNVSSGVVVIEAGVGGKSVGDFHLVLCDEEDSGKGVMKSGKNLKVLFNDLKLSENSFRKNGFKWLNVPYIEQLVPVGRVSAHKTVEDVHYVSNEYKRYCDEYMDEPSTRECIEYVISTTDGFPKYRDKKDEYVHEERMRFFLNMQHYCGLMRYGLCVLGFKEHKWFCFGYRSTEARVDVLIGKNVNRVVKYNDVYGKEIEFEKEFSGMIPVVEELFGIFGLGKYDHAPVDFIDEPDFEKSVANTKIIEISDLDDSYKKDADVRWNRMKKNARKFEEGFNGDVFEKDAKFVKNFIYEIYKSYLDEYLFKLSYREGNVRMVFSDEDNYKKDGVLQIDANVKDDMQVFDVKFLKGSEERSLTLINERDSYRTTDIEYVRDIVREFVCDFYPCD